MNDSPKTCSIHAPCKINLHLAVGDRRPDGFHELESIFAALDFGDDLYFKITGSKNFFKLRLSQSINSGIFPENDNLISGISLKSDNLISRAVELFRAETGLNHGLQCVLEKRIPLGAGLGGGSSDAASTLIALNSLFSAGLPAEKLLEMAAKLGSDVPFFLYGGVAKVTGRGECIKPLPALPDYAVLLVKPSFRSSTAEAFRLLDEYRNSSENLRSSGSAGSACDNFMNEEWPYFNDFLSILPQADIYREICRDLLRNGAEFAGLSGSGSCCFGIFKDYKKALKAKKSIKSQKIQFNLNQCTFFLASAAIPVLK